MDEIIKERMLRTLKASAEDKWLGGECKTRALREIYLTDLKDSCFNENYLGDDVPIDIQDKFYWYLDAIRNEFEGFIEVYVMPSYEDTTAYFMIQDNKLVYRDSCKTWHFWWKTEEGLVESMYEIYKKIWLQQERTWNTWVLSESDIIETAKQNDLSLEGKDLDEIARQFQKGICSMLGSGGYDWTDVLEEAIENTKTEGLSQSPGCRFCNNDCPDCADIVEKETG